MSEYLLRCSLDGHKQDVRSLDTQNSNVIITASRDGTAKLWKSNENDEFVEHTAYMGHTSYVTCITVAACNNETYIVTGSKDTSILIFELLSGKVYRTLSHHKDTVSCLTWKSDFLISGSWDNSVAVWHDWSLQNKLTGHEGPVWAVALINTGSEFCELLTASADKTIKFWQGNNVSVTFRGHTDCVRGLAVCDKESFISCSNDASIRLWNFTGSCLATFYGHNSFIYSIEIIKGSDELEFASSSEDRTVKIWKGDGRILQTIHFPTQSIWCVKSLSNGDIVCGSSDGKCRIFSRYESRQASEQELKGFEVSVSKSQVPTDLGGLQKEMIPGKEALLKTGKKDGQTIMVRDDGKILCYSWNSSKHQWDLVGEIIGGSGGSANTSGKVLYEGKEYDFVFDVELDEGFRLKLPYNSGDDPYMVAQQFIHKHELPQEHLDRVAQFILKNAGAAALYITSDYQDPFTGNSRYVPGTNSLNQNISESKSQFVSSSYFPLTMPLLFENCNAQGMLVKMKECNVMAPNPLDISNLESIIDLVSHPKENIDPQIFMPLEAAFEWPVHLVWPVLDILRLGLQFITVQEYWASGEKGATLTQLLINLVQSSCPSNTLLLSLRCLANMMAHSPGQDTMLSFRDNVVSKIAEISPFPNKGMEIAASTVMLNLCVVVCRKSNINSYLEDVCQLLSGAGTLLMCCNDSEAIFRSLVAVGTLLTLSNDVVELAKSLDIKNVVLSLNDRHSFFDAKVKNCVDDLLMLL